MKFDQVRVGDVYEAPLAYGETSPRRFVITHKSERQYAGVLDDGWAVNDPLYYSDWPFKLISRNRTVKVTVSND